MPNIRVTIPAPPRREIIPAMAKHSAGAHAALGGYFCHLGFKVLKSFILKGKRGGACSRRTTAEAGTQGATSCYRRWRDSRERLAPHIVWRGERRLTGDERYHEAHCTASKIAA